MVAWAVYVSVLPSWLLPTGAAVACCGFGGLLKIGKHTLVVNLLAAYVVGRVVTAIGDTRCICVIKECRLDLDQLMHTELYLSLIHI